MEGWGRARESRGEARRLDGKATKRQKRPGHRCLGPPIYPCNGQTPLSSMLETGVGVLPCAGVKTSMDDRRHRLAFREITHDHR